MSDLNAIAEVLTWLMVGLIVIIIPTGIYGLMKRKVRIKPRHRPRRTGDE